jgi:ParB-like chromosome segregation protein Spo0J
MGDHDLAPVDRPGNNFHAACLLLPEVSADAYRALLEDIKEHGQRHPIIVDDGGVILDGRHRLRALQELDREPNFETFVGTESEKIALIMSENVHRRHLSVQQLAAVAADLAEELAKAAHDRKSAGLRQNQPLAPTGAPMTETAPSASTEAAKGKSAKQAAKMVGGVSQRSVERAIARKKADPEAHEAAKAGQLKKTKPVRRPATTTKAPADRRPSKSARPDISGMIRDLNVAWPLAAVKNYHPTADQASVLRAHLPDVLAKMHILAGFLASDPAFRPEPAPAETKPKGNGTDKSRPEGA